MTTRFCLSRHVLRLLLMAATLLFVSVAHADTIFYDDFSQEPVNRLDVGSLANWNIVSGSVDVIGAGNLCSGTCLDMDGTSYAKGPLSIESKQTFAVAPGWYEVYFDIAGSQRNFGYDAGHTNSVRLSVDGQSTTVALGTFDPFRTESLLFQADGAFKIRFDALESPDYVGLLLNDVGLRTATGPTPQEPEPPTPVPEPPTGWMLSSLVGLIAWKTWRRA